MAQRHVRFSIPDQADQQIYFYSPDSDDEREKKRLKEKKEAQAKKDAYRKVINQLSSSKTVKFNQSY